AHPRLRPRELRVSSRERPTDAPHGDPLEVFASNGVTATAELAAAADGTACANCGAPLAPDQRYCLACGQPASPVRLAFLDVLQGEYQPPLAGVSSGIGVPGGP